MSYEWARCRCPLGRRGFVQLSSALALMVFVGSFIYCAFLVNRLTSFFQECYDSIAVLIDQTNSDNEDKTYFSCYYGNHSFSVTVKAAKWYQTNMPVVVGVAAIIFLIYILTHLALTLGVTLKKRSLMLPFLLTTFLEILVILALLAYILITNLFLTAWPIDTGFIVLIVVLTTITAVLRIYYWSLVWSVYSQLANEASGDKVAPFGQWTKSDPSINDSY